MRESDCRFVNEFSSLFSVKLLEKFSPGQCKKSVDEASFSFPIFTIKKILAGLISLLNRFVIVTN